MTMRLLPSHQRAEPYGGITKNHAAGDVGHAGPETAIANGSECLPLEAGKSRVAAEKADHQKRPPVRAARKALGEQRDEKSNQKAAGDIDCGRAQKTSTVA